MESDHAYYVWQIMKFALYLLGNREPWKNFNQGSAIVRLFFFELSTSLYMEDGKVQRDIGGCCKEGNDEK